MKGILGQKIGMTQIYTAQGNKVPVTVIEVKPNVVTHKFENTKDGYVALQLGAFDQKERKFKKPEIGHFKKSNTTPKRFVKEIRNMDGYNLGDLVKADIFKSGELVDVTGISKGKGFAGTIKRHNQKIGPKSHGGGGGSKPVRQTGSIGDIAGNKVLKGMTMPGHLGNVQRTIQNLEVVKVDIKNNILLVKGSVPGPKNCFLIIKSAIKNLPSREAIELVNIKEAILKNQLLESAKKYGAEVSVDMKIHEMEEIIHAAMKEKEKLEQEAKQNAEKSNSDDDVRKEAEKLNKNKEDKGE
ncbi:50S ribosomal protein L3 [[Mycoplasma] mobile]|uniref:Large ribosomal subunit protein uL3 n=1 Tax=Mycoplasma mobile (strain ATCC 43663 / 163K / NCTC 11711) TaxID=267748 RepID=RL3_MYCM1|nr:50S ribosomal protein L3 [[Mycoplasma] mobile]Q6KI55.1 RecName: Full=Large ribosomal subunit protein uL3; AltName: Full=50S ribosomal protein L3 [Mycoplasma mobile 163K]AAT27721.1 50S ribosomal protein l3 [Mycoplasma mobile 163K]